MGFRTGGVLRIVAAAVPAVGLRLLVNRIDRRDFENLGAVKGIGFIALGLTTIFVTGSLFCGGINRVLFGQEVS